VVNSAVIQTTALRSRDGVSHKSLRMDTEMLDGWDRWKKARAFSR